MFSVPVNTSFNKFLNDKNTTDVSAQPITGDFISTKQLVYLRGLIYLIKDFNSAYIHSTKPSTTYTLDMYFICLSVVNTEIQL